MCFYLDEWLPLLLNLLINSNNKNYQEADIKWDLVN